MLSFAFTNLAQAGEITVLRTFAQLLMCVFRIPKPSGESREIPGQTDLVHQLNGFPKHGRRIAGDLPHGVQGCLVFHAHDTAHHGVDGSRGPEEQTRGWDGVGQRAAPEEVHHEGTQHEPKDDLFRRVPAEAFHSE